MNINIGRILTPLVLLNTPTLQLYVMMVHDAKNVVHMSVLSKNVDGEYLSSSNIWSRERDVNRIAY